MVDNNKKPQEQNLSRHDLRESKKEERIKAKESNLKEGRRKKLIKKIVIWAIVIIILLGIIFLFYRAISISKDFKPYTPGSVHWHTNFEVFLCGERQDFTKGYDLEINGKGSYLLHSHNDNVIHIEGQILKKEDIALGNFFDIIDVPFSKTQIMDKRNGDLCQNDSTGEVHMYVNGVENNEFRNFIPEPCTSENIKEDCDKIDIKFE